MQSDLFHRIFPLHVSDVTEPIITSNKNFNRGLWGRS